MTLEQPGETPKPIAAPVMAWLRGALLNNGRTKIVALTLSVAAFVFVNTDKDATIGVIVPVRYHYPENRVLITEPAHRVRLSVSGPRRRIQRFDHREIETVEIDLTNARSGEFVFQEDLFPLPAGLELVSINPATMRLAFENKVTKEVRVEVVTDGNVARNHRVETLEAKPLKVTIRGAQSIVDGVSSVATHEIALAGKTKSFRATTELARPKQTVEIVDPQPVVVRVSIIPKLAIRTLKAVPVEVRPGPTSGNAANVRVHPKKVSIVLHGDAAVVERANVAAFVVLSRELGTKRRRVTVMIDGVPKGVATEVTPRRVTVKQGRR